MKVISEIEIYEINDKDVRSATPKTMNVSSHWNSKDFVNIQINDQTYTVGTRELSDAIIAARQAHPLQI